MGNKRRHKHGGKASKNQIQNGNIFVTEIKLKNKENVLPGSSDSVIKSKKGKKKLKIIQKIEKGHFGKEIEAILITGNKYLIQIDANSTENFKEIEYSSNLESFEILSRTITKKNSTSIKLRGNCILKEDFGQNLKLEEFFAFSKINNERIRCFPFKNIVKNLTLKKSLIKNKSLKSKFTNVIFENILKDDCFKLFNNEMLLEYSITFNNANSRNRSQENIYFTLNCVECNSSIFICQSLNALFSFKSSNHKRCEIYKNQQNYLSLIYNGCFFPILKIRNCYKCSSINFDNNQKMDPINYLPMSRDQYLCQTTSFSQVNKSVKIKDYNSHTSNKGFISHENKNTFNFESLESFNNSFPMILENNGRDNLHEQNALEGETKQNNTFSSFDLSKLSGLPEINLILLSLLNTIKKTCNCSYFKDFVNICDSCKENSILLPYMKETYNACMMYINTLSLKLQGFNKDQNLNEKFCKGILQTENAVSNVKIINDQTNLNLNCDCTCLPNIKTKSNISSIDRLINGRESLLCDVNTESFVSDINSGNVLNQFKKYLINGNEFSISNGTNLINNKETTRNDIHVENINQFLELKRDCKDYLDHIESNKYQINFLSNNNSAATDDNFSLNANQKCTVAENQNSCLDCSKNLMNYQKWNNCQGFRPNENIYNDIGSVSNKFVPISNSTETAVSDVESQNNSEIDYLYDDKVDFVNKSKIYSLCFPLETNEKIEGINFNRGVRLSTNQHYKHSNISELIRENQLIPKKVYTSQTGVPKYLKSHLPSHPETNSVSKFDLPNYSCNFKISNLQPCHIYNTSHSDYSGNLSYRTIESSQCENENPNYSAQILSSTSNNETNFSFYDKDKYRSFSSYKTTCNNFDKSNLSDFSLNGNEISSRQFKFRGNYFNVIDNNRFFNRNNCISFNSRQNRKSLSSFPNYTNNNSNFSRGNFRSSLQPIIKLRGNYLQNYKKPESFNPNFNRQILFTPTFKSNFSQPSYYRGKSYHGYEYKKNCREMFNAQEDFFNAAANPNSYTQ